MIGTDAQLAIVEEESEALANAVDGDLTTPIPGLDWTVADLAEHIAGTYWWFRAWSANEDPNGRVRFRERPIRPDDVTPHEWLTRQAAETRAFWATADPDRPCPTIMGPGTVAWWIRRAMLELAVHLVDAQRARGTAEPIPAEVAVAGIDESLTEFLPSLLAFNEPRELSGTIHLHCTDVEGEWLVRLGPAGDGSGRTTVEVTTEHAKGDVAVRGRASDLYLTLWGRPITGEGDLQIFGDDDLFTELVRALKA
jgi:uncharacterized protein (TIGR03083 family)